MKRDFKWVTLSFLRCVLHEILKPCKARRPYVTKLTQNLVIPQHLSPIYLQNIQEMLYGTMLLKMRTFSDNSVMYGITFYVNYQCNCSILTYVQLSLKDAKRFSNTALLINNYLLQMQSWHGVR